MSLPSFPYLYNNTPGYDLKHILPPKLHVLQLQLHTRTWRDHTTFIRDGWNAACKGLFGLMNAQMTQSLSLQRLIWWHSHKSFSHMGKSETEYKDRQLKDLD